MSIPSDDSWSREPLPVYAIYGSEAFLKRQAFREFFHRDMGLTPGDPGCVEFSCDTELAPVLDELRTVPMFSDHRVVIVQDADPFITRYRQALETYCESPASSASLLLVCNRFDARTRLHRIVKKNGRVIKCEPVHWSQINSWICNQAQAVYGKAMDPRTAALLRRLVGDDLGTLDSELGKLATYASDQPQITADAVQRLIGHYREEKVFAIADAMAEQQPARALKLWDQVWMTDRAAVGRSIAGLAWALRKSLETKYRTGTKAVPARQDHGGSDNMIQRLRDVPTERLEDQLMDLLRLDVNVKTGLREVRTGLERFIVEHSTAPDIR